jgi:PAS domain S-box-containing protein
MVSGSDSRSTGSALVPPGLGRSTALYLAAIVEHAREAIVSQTADGVVLSWNPAAQSAFGYTADEMLGRSLLNLFPAHSTPDVTALLALVRDGHAVDRFDTTWRRKDGTWIDVALTFSPVKNAQGEAMAVSTIVRDMSLEKNLRTELNRERVLIDSAFDVLRDIFFIVDLEGRLVRWNTHLASVSGYNEIELRRMRAVDLFTGSACRDVEEAIAEVLSKGNAHLTADGLTRDGRIIPFELRGSILKDGDGTPYAICGIARDISERRQNEEALRLTQFAIDHCSDAAFWLEADGRIFYVNQEACRSLGYTREELLGRSVYDIDPNFLCETWNDHWRLLKEKHSLRLESVHRCKSGHNIPVDISAQYVRFGDREYYCAFARDLTEKKRAQQKTREYEMRMHASQRMEALGSLAGGIAHDFNNILSSILGFSQLAMDNIPENTDPYDNIREIFRAGLRARDLVRQILAFSRRTEDRKEAIQIKPVVEEVLKLMRASLPTTIEIQTDLRSNDLIMADAGQIHQVLMNLCTNAGQAMQPEGGLLQVCLDNVELTGDDTAAYPGCTPGPHVELVVTDSGEGIEPELLDRIFNPFFTTKQQGEGTGLGLSVVHGIVRSHNGFVRVRSKVGEGAAFSVFLPLLQKKRVPSPQDKNRLHIDQDLPTGKEHILLVDDEHSVGRMTMMMLKKFNYQVTCLASSIEALAFFNDAPQSYDLVISDVSMPYLPGQKLAAELMKIRPDIPVILCTGGDDPISEVEAQEMKIQGLLTKPVEKSVLAQKVREVLDRRGSMAKHNGGHAP